MSAPDELRAGAALRWVRAAALAGTALVFAAVAHAAAGGVLPDPLAMLLIAALTAGWLATLLGRPASTARVVVLLAGGQALLHGIFTAAGGHPGADAAVAGPQHLGMSHVAVPSGRLADALGAGELAGRLSTGPSPVGAWMHHLLDDLSTLAHLEMAAAHMVAACGLGIWLATGERLVWRLVVLLGERAPAAVRRVRTMVDEARLPTGPAVTEKPRLGRVAKRRHRQLRSLLLARTLGRRGPPVLCS